jgi:hypothetical protein
MTIFEGDSTGPRVGTSPNLVQETEVLATIAATIRDPCMAVIHPRTLVLPLTQSSAQVVSFDRQTPNTPEDPSEMDRLTPQESRVVERATLHLNAQAWGVSFGLLSALIIFVATMVLVLKGGVNVGDNLRLLGNFLPGYRVTFLGAFIGFIYLFVIGYAFGRLIGVVYNFAARR